VFSKKSRENYADIYVKQDKVYRNIVEMHTVGRIVRKEAEMLRKKVNIR